MTGEQWTAWDCEPDYVFPTFIEAINFILRDPFRSCFERIYEDFLQAFYQGPFIITIDGRLTPAARNFANYFARSFREMGRSVRRVSFDDWLLRQVKDGSRERSAESAGPPPELALLDEILSAGPRRAGDAEGVPDVLIIDGAVPRRLERLRQKSRFRVFCELEDGTAAARLESFLAWRGFDAAAVEALLSVQRRQQADADRAADGANLIIALTEGGSVRDHHAHAIPG
jgi:hypothetical protein